LGMQIGSIGDYHKPNQLHYSQASDSVEEGSC